MSQISQKSISGITSITTPAGVDNQFTIHTNNTSEALKLDHAGNIHIHNHVNTTGISSASNFKTGSSNLHSSGLSAASIDVGNNIKLGNAGVITATSFVGDGSDLTNLPAGLGTALSATASSPLNKMYYTNQVLGVPSSITVDVPASASKAYTQYADIKVESSADLIIAEGDDLIPDVLGLADFGTFGGGASAGRIRVNSISNAANDGSPTVQKGLVVTGVCTATSFSGDGSALTGIAGDKISEGNTEAEVVDTGSDGHFKVTTEGSERLRINSSGQVKIQSGTVIHFTNTNNDITTDSSDGSDNKRIVISGGGATDSSRGANINLTGNEYSGANGKLELTAGNSGNTNGSIDCYTGGSLRLKIDTGGRFLKGVTSAAASRSSTSVRYPHFQLSSPWSSGLGSYKIECTDDYPIIFIDSGASYANGSGAGTITWSVKDSSGDYCNTASVVSRIDNTPSNDSAPGRLEFHTTTSGATSTEKARIDSLGNLGLGIAAVPQDSGARTLHVHSTTTGSGARAALRLTHGSTGSAASNGGFLGMDNNPDLYLYNQENGNLRFGTNGSERMRIDSSGAVQNLAQPFVMVHINTRTDWATTGSQMVIPWDTIHARSTNSNFGSHFNTSNHRFTAPVDGRYLFLLSLNIVGDNILYHRINGQNVSGGEYRMTQLVWDHAEASFIYDMNANDY
ncbi:MAG: hypothetical protein CM15mP42_05500 [Methanobacteriota archaeon]|nr:MAG: hypothetical protein CM15mP42_05500 [Euryarchaeota archaeon]